MSWKNHPLRMLQMIRSCELIWTFKTSSSLFSSIVPNPTCTDLVIFFLLGTLFHLLRICVFDTKSSKTSSLNTSGSIRKRSWNAFIKAWSSQFLFQAEESVFLVFFKEIGRLGPYIRSGPSRIKFFDTWSQYWLACLFFCASFLASLFFFLFLASCLFP